MGGGRPLISVAIPIYNSATFLENTIKSVLNQSFQDFELLLINDGSSDNSLKVCEKFISNPKVKIFSDGVNKGLVFRLNESIIRARGKYYARMDADDIMHPERLDKQVAFMQEHKDVDVIGASAYLIDGGNNIKGIRQATTSKEGQDVRGFIHPSVMGKTEWFRKNPYDSKFLRIEDKELWLRTFRASKFENLEETLLYYREEGVPITSKYVKTQISALRLSYKLLSYGFGIKDSLKLAMFSLLKVFAIYGFSLIGQPQMILNFRKKSIVNNFQVAKSDLDRALAPIYLNGDLKV